MRLPLFWMTDYVDPGLAPAVLAARLAMTGTEVDRVFTHGVTALDAFVVGRVLERSQHPDADRLSVCRVSTGEGDVAQIVCGAPNVAAGQTVAVALPGAVMPDGTRLKRTKLRGVESQGMILAEDEVAIGLDHDGIMVLDDGLLEGTPLADVLPIATDVLELEITPNRPDCLSVYGAAREVHAATGAPLSPPPWLDDPGTPGPVEGVTIDVQAPDFCPRFTARLFEDVQLGPSPPWLKARLMASGQRPINNVVDITNYVMLLTGQPLHAFDWDLVAGGRLVVRWAGDGEKMTTLDDLERTLDSDMGLICDDAGPTSIAGIMGGQRSEVQPTTTRVLMEAANWNGPNLQRISQRLALRTEASARFEKGLAPEITMWGQAVSTRLMIELCGARLVPGTVDVGGEGPPPKTLRLRDAKVTRLLGTAVPVGEQAELLERLEFGVDDCGRRARRHGSGLPSQRRHSRGRPDRGGRAPLGPGEVARDDPRARLERPVDGRAAAAAARGRRARRSRLQRGRRLELPGARGGTQAAAGRTCRAAAQPALGGPLGDAHDAARLAADRGSPQRRARARGRAPVRGGRGLLRPPARP